MNTYRLATRLTFTDGVSTGPDVDGRFQYGEDDEDGPKAILLQYKPQILYNGPTAMHVGLFVTGVTLFPDDDTPGESAKSGAGGGSSFNTGFN